ncbi:Translation initiation factor IF [Trema orientale]|uniref:Translation initiation factor IF-1, chloroplastic n=1 Tax=Trema orientale TaxID=63057 RepID=A0A2P5F053_TREOI|nr:Translation initiation factor IF [Trema orientale]
MGFYPYRYSNSSFTKAKPPVDSSYINPTNTSCQISLRLHSSVSQVNESLLLDILAEGIYDETTGSLCMVGYRYDGLHKLWSKHGTVDCEILVNFQFLPRNSKDSSGFIKRIFESKRKNFDPLHFEPLRLSSAAFVADEVYESILRTDVEIDLALISNTLSCVFVVLQLFHLRKNPDVVPFVLMTMLLTLSLAYIIPLILDLKFIFMTSHSTPDVLLGINEWLEAKQVTEGVTTVILFLLQARLLRLTWSMRRSSSEGGSDRLQIAEKESMFVTLTILVKLFRDSKENALAYPYYIGTTLVKLLPHAYGLYKAQNSASKLLSIAWDVMITFGALIFAIIIYLQQCSGTLHHALLHLPLAPRTSTPLLPAPAASANIPESQFSYSGLRTPFFSGGAKAKQSRNPNPNPNRNGMMMVVEAMAKSGGSKESPEQQKWSQEGLVTESLPNGMFRIRLDNADMIIGYISGKIRKSFIRILPGDRVKVEVSRYDSTRGRIIYRLRTSNKDPS